LHLALCLISIRAAVQVVCCGSLLLALNLLKQVNNAYFRIGFNSLGAYGTINHLHFQVRLSVCQFYCGRV
jgi:GDP-L-galactose phosphorylase